MAGTLLTFHYPHKVHAEKMAGTSLTFHYPQKAHFIKNQDSWNQASKPS